MKIMARAAKTAAFLYVSNLPARYYIVLENEKTFLFSRVEGSKLPKV